MLFLSVILISNFMGEKTASALTLQTGQTLQITTLDGKNVNLAITGNASVSQFKSFSFQNLPDWYNNTNIAFTLFGLNGSASFVNMTIPKNAILGGTLPVVTINGGLSHNNGYAYDTENFYVWFTTQAQPLNSPLYYNQSQITIQFVLSTRYTPISFCRQTFTLPELGVQSVTVNLNQGETLSGNIYLSDNYEKAVNFKVIDPNGKSVINHDHVTSKMWHLVASKNGVYTVVVNNPAQFSTIDGMTFEYTILANDQSHDDLGLFLRLGVSGLLIAVAVGLAVISTKRFKTKYKSETVTFLRRENV